MQMFILHILFESKFSFMCAEPVHISSLIQIEILVGRNKALYNADVDILYFV